MKDFFKSRAGELVIVALVFFSAILFFTITPDDYGSFSYFSLPSGQFSDFSCIDYYYLGVIGLSTVYKFFYGILPAYNWMGISFLAFGVLALYLILRAIKDVVLKNNDNPYLLRTIQVLFALFFIENFVSISHTRYSLLLCGIGLFNLAFTKDIKWKGVITNTLLFVLGMLIRPESSIGMLLLVSIGYLIYCFDLKHWVTRLFFPMAATGILFTAFAIDWAHTTLYVKQVEPEIEYKIMDRRVVPLATMKTAKDSIKYEVAMQGMWFDTAVLSPKFLRSLLLPGMNLSPAHACSIFFHLVSLYKYYLFIPFLLGGFLLLGLFGQVERSVFLKIIVFQLAVFGLIYALDFNGSLVAGRHFLILQLIALLITSFCFSHGVYRFGRTAVVIYMAAVFCSTAITLWHYKKYNHAIAQSNECCESYMQNIENTYHNRIIVTTMGSVYLMNHNFSVKHKNYTKNKWLLYDAFTYSLSPDYTAYLSRQCNCNATDPVAFYSWLASQNGLYMSNQRYFDLTKEYMNVIHNQPLRFVPDKHLEKPECIFSTNLPDVDVLRVAIGDEH